ncbi:hypothetical protein SO802_030819 [Lithocarpus litseifolius]|uniref:Reverse transcriptase domain-containing protein n=1 Tax=Lithocarpus litseifolius TaxID=425828 RepID=A0AAW2BJZ9_9ROSI
MALKLNMSKAYDRVEWRRLEKIMEKLGFVEKWRDLVMRCVTSVTYSVKINEKPRGHFFPSRGLRQGDPLSPYLFLLCAEGLSALIKVAVDKGVMSGLAMCRNGPKISHLFFADDSLIFCKASFEECNALQQVLEVYEKASGQQLNRAKTSLFFNGNTPRGVKEEIKTRFGAQVIKQHEKYLGLPSLEKLLFKAGKEILIKAVAQAIPTYTMSCFKTPDFLYEELTGMIRNFWWGQRRDEKKEAWMSWDKLCESKEKSGMGFKQLKQFNLGLLAKQSWRLQMQHNSLAYRVLKAKYFPNCDFIHAPLGTNLSFTWRSIRAAEELVKFGLRWRIGNGDSVRVWEDKWLPTATTYKVSSPRLFLDPDTWVGELINKEEACWKTEAINSLSLPHEAEVIRGIPISSRLPEDKQIWALDSKGIFTVKSAYYGAIALSRSGSVASLSDISREKRFWKLIWSLPVPHKIRHFTWRACRDILPTKSKLLQRKVVQDDTCDGCGLEAETSSHLFWSCARAKEFWACSKLIIPSNLDQCRSFKDLMWRLLMIDEARFDLAAKMVTGAWSLWNNRNVVRVGGVRKAGDVLMRGVVQYLEENNEATSLSSHIETPAVQAHSWIPPTAPHFKINVDGATFAKLKAVGIGVLVRDDQGRVIAALSKKIHAPLGAVEAEAKACEEGMQFAKDLGIQEFILEGDSLIIFRALAGLSSPPIAVDSVMQGLKSFSGEFCQVSFLHVRHQGNKAAHLLAKHAKGIADFST